MIEGWNLGKKTKRKTSIRIKEIAIHDLDTNVNVVLKVTRQKGHSLREVLGIVKEITYKFIHALLQLA